MRDRDPQPVDDPMTDDGTPLGDVLSDGIDQVISGLEVRGKVKRRNTVPTFCYNVAQRSTGRKA